MNISNYNNLGVYSLAICAVLEHKKEMTIAETLLVPPLITHNELLNHLARKTTNIYNADDLLFSKTSFFSNFNYRFSDSLVTSLNAILFLQDTNYISYNEGNVKLSELIPYHTEMGKRAKKIYQASKNISTFLTAPTEYLYLNLRVEL
ncbi:hypothetical protein JD516_04715 [Aeromonas jandaei]|uniref:hypothetical protein n=1 Tax=Aeromonas jandaei TaxID=650 RepID=UPI00191ECC47|nr:hypothetical protein [Aeromonas jandaei]MBL0597120.1 hypothetical protein [Aeromonas jandaei]